MSPADKPTDAIQALGDFFDEAAPPEKKPEPPRSKPPSAVPGQAPQAAAPGMVQQAAAPGPAVSARPAAAQAQPAAPAAFEPALAGSAAQADGRAVPAARPGRESPPPKTWECKAGKVVFQEEESSFDLFILEEGKVEIMVAEERVAIVDKPGSSLGEIGALLRRPRSAMVRCLTPCTFTVYRDFEALMQHDPEKLLIVARTLALRLADTNERIQKVFGILYQHKVRDEVVDNVALALQGKKPKPNQKKSFWHKLGF